MKQIISIGKSLAFVAVLAILVVGLSQKVYSEQREKTVIVSGVAVLQGQNTSGARAAAVQDALRHAVEQGVGMMMNATSIVKNDDLLEKIYTNTQGYIANYDVIKECTTPNGLYQVKVRATVKTGALKDSLVRLGIIKAMMDYPRLLILPNPGTPIKALNQTAEATLLKVFTDKRFDVVDPGKSRELHDEARDLLKVNTAENAAARIGLKHHAEVVILYDLEEGAAEFDGVMEQVPVIIRAKALVTTTAQVLSAREQNATGVGKTPVLARHDGIRRAAEGIAKNMVNTIVSWWTDYTSNGLPYTVTLQTRPKADRLVIAFEQALESIPGVVSLTERSSGGGITEIMVKYKGTTTQLKREILSSLDGRHGFGNLHTEASKGRFLVFSVK